MFKFFRSLFRRLSCRRHRWRTDKRKPGYEWCDLCRARRRAPSKGR